jgi:pimeloyl-ACP methyl ester carboxylesterase
MGCLVAVRIARLRPDLVKRLILYQMPLYTGLPDRRHYSVRRDFYFRIYKRLGQWPPDRAQSGLRRIIIRMTGLQLSADNWQPFVRSLRSTIMEQATLQDIYALRMPIDVIYGSLDMVVIRGKPKTVFAQVLAPLQTHTIAQLHGVSARASKFIAKRIVAADTTTLSSH